MNTAFTRKRTSITRFPKGVAFPFIQRFLGINKAFPKQLPVEVVLLSRNSPETGLRVFRSIKHYGLDITRAAFMTGRSPHEYVPAFNASLFLRAVGWGELANPNASGGWCWGSCRHPNLPRYFPPPVRRVEIPKSNGKLRPLGIPTISDRIAQMVIKNRLESLVEPQFHDDSYGYRPGKSALDAIAQARQRCWRDDWVLDMDIKGFFDALDHGLVM